MLTLQESLLLGGAVLAVVVGNRGFVPVLMCIAAPPAGRPLAPCRGPIPPAPTLPATPARSADAAAAAAAAAPGLGLALALAARAAGAHQRQVSARAQPVDLPRRGLRCAQRLLRTLLPRHLLRAGLGVVVDAAVQHPEALRARRPCAGRARLLRLRPPLLWIGERRTGGSSAGAGAGPLWGCFGTGPGRSGADWRRRWRPAVIALGISNAVIPWAALG